MRAYLNGHRSKASGAIYNRRHIKEVSDRAIRHVQESLTNSANESERDNEVD